MGAEPQKAEKNDELVERKGKGVAGREGQREFRRGCGRGVGRAELCWETCGDSKVCPMGLGLLRRACGRRRDHRSCACSFATALLASQVQEGHWPADGCLLLEQLLPGAEKPRCGPPVPHRPCLPQAVGPAAPR